MASRVANELGMKLPATIGAGRWKVNVGDKNSFRESDICECVKPRPRLQTCRGALRKFVSQCITSANLQAECYSSVRVRIRLIPVAANAAALCPWMCWRSCNGTSECLVDLGHVAHA